METLVPLSVVGIWKYLAAAWIRRDIERQFQYFGTVSCINLYPVKGCHATRVKSAQCGARGLEVNGVKDRYIMIVDIQTGIGQYMKHFPKMTFITVTVDDGSIVLDAPDMESLCLPHNPDLSQQLIICEIHACKLMTRDFGDEAAKWIAKYLENENLRLVHFMESNNRLTIETDNNRRQGNLQISQDDKTFYADYTVFLTEFADELHPALDIRGISYANERTLEELAKQTPESIKMDNFRPNIVIDGKSPFEEDTWSQVRIGENVVFRCHESCRRCMVTTIDTDTAQRSRKNEPLKTMKKYKESLGGVPTSFGVYAAAERGGEIHVGDQVYVLK